MSALHWAAEGGHYNCVKTLLKYGSDPNNVTKDYHTSSYFYVSSDASPLMLACKGGYSMVSELLIKYGAKLDLRDSEGYTALSYAIKQNSGPCVKVLAVSGVELDSIFIGSDGIASSPLFRAITKCRTEALRELIRSGCDVNMLGMNDEGEFMTAFELALSMYHIDYCKMLLAADFKLQMINREVLEQGMIMLCARDEGTFMWLCRVMRTPPLLSELCRGVIRQQLGRRVATDLDQLPLPPTIRSFVNLQELNDLE